MRRDFGAGARARQCHTPYAGFIAHLQIDGGRTYRTRRGRRIEPLRHDVYRLNLLGHRRPIPDSARVVECRVCTTLRIRPSISAHVLRNDLLIGEGRVRPGGGNALNVSGLTARALMAGASAAHQRLCRTAAL